MYLLTSIVMPLLNYRNTNVYGCRATAFNEEFVDLIYWPGDSDTEK